MTLPQLFLLFIFYSFIGWCAEVIYSLIYEKKFVDRGFLLGPLCPIYGVGALLIIFLLKRYIDQPITLFCMAIVICAILEYFTSLILEKMFNARWWDYSHNKFNINGRICLEALVLFGLGAVGAMYVINPVLEVFVRYIPGTIVNALALILFVAFLADCIVSFSATLRIKTTIKRLAKDNTEEMTREVKRIVSSQQSFLRNRLMKAFPGFEAKAKHKKH